MENTAVGGIVAVTIAVMVIMIASRQQSKARREKERLEKERLEKERPEQ